MKTFFEERDDNEAYRNMRIRLRYVFRKLKPFLLKTKVFFGKIWLKLRPVLAAILKVLKNIWKFVATPFSKLRKKLNKKDKKR